MTTGFEIGKAFKHVRNGKYYTLFAVKDEHYIFTTIIFGDLKPSAPVCIKNDNSSFLSKLQPINLTLQEARIQHKITTLNNEALKLNNSIDLMNSRLSEIEYELAEIRMGNGNIT